MKILILGSNSFAGTTFVTYLLKKKFNVISTSRSKEKSSPFNIFQKHKREKNYKYFKININHSNDLKKLEKILINEKINIVVDFSSQSMVGQSWSTPLDWLNTNCLGKMKLISLLNKFETLLRK